ncbi:hypothetical protein CgunFtcFv8_000292 [Champsocephalus gunnari]|uniref:Uncharacterized protein n=1 Tax=Champsocephalus gunnari TaxID=52237 RepID=A0AAN8DI85_CHAGU|nr:hypothetical protein CgunFtcFv8_000292 [Champsocephalus gunnari]
MGEVKTLDVGTPSALTPADLPDERDLCPSRSHNPSISSRPSRLQGRSSTYTLQLTLGSGYYSLKQGKTKSKDVGSCDVC